jgi:exopolysaccharide biosynthesis protein
MAGWIHKRETRVILLLGLASVGIVAPQTVERPFRGVTHITRQETSPRPVTMQVVTVNLSDPGVRVKVSPPAGTRETVRETTLSFLKREHAQVAINAHFFLPFPSADPNADVIGLAASEGKVYSGCERPVQSYAIVANAPAINFDREGHASIVRCNDETSVLWNAIAGSAQIVTSGAVTIPFYKDTEHPGGLLTANGDYSNRRSWYDLLRARTAAGLTRNRETLVLFTVEASQNGEASGMSVGEIASVLVKDYAVYNAINLDGGGSTSLAIDGKMVTSGTREVASSLAIFAERQ